MAYVRKKDNFQKEPITLLLFIVAIWSFEACLEPNQTTEMELSTKTITQFKINGIFVKIFTSDNWLGFWAHFCD